MKLNKKINFQPKEIILKNNKKIIIRMPSINDKEAYIKMYSEISEEDNCYYLGSENTTKEHAIKKAEKSIDPADVTLIIDGLDGNIYGEAWYTWKQGESKSIFGIYISPVLQGNGLGKILMNNLIELAKQYGPRIITLTVQKENERAVSLYKKTGFEIIREQIRPARKECGEMKEYYMEYNFDK